MPHMSASSRHKHVELDIRRLTSGMRRGPGVSLQPVQRGSAVDAVLDQMHEQVASGAWAVGDRIPGEHELSAVLRVSRPAVREAIRALSHVGVLEVRRGDGTYVRSAADPRPLLHQAARASARDFFELQLGYD